MMGNAGNVKGCLCIFTVGGSVGCNRSTTESTRCSVKIMSEPQLKNKSTWADPLLVVDRTLCKPGTLLTASSSGRVMVTSIWSIGITPLSTPMAMLVKSVLGKTEIGTVNARE